MCQVYECVRNGQAGMCRVRVRYVLGICQGCVRDVSGMCQGYVRDVSGIHVPFPGNRIMISTLIRRLFKGGPTDIRLLNSLVSNIL